MGHRQAPDRCRGGAAWAEDAIPTKSMATARSSPWNAREPISAIPLLRALRPRLCRLQLQRRARRFGVGDDGGELDLQRAARFEAARGHSWESEIGRLTRPGCTARDVAETT